MEKEIRKLQNHFNAGKKMDFKQKFIIPLMTGFI